MRGGARPVPSALRANRRRTRCSFSIEQGELVGFLGPNGAGKTTTLKMLSGLLYPTHGSARVLGLRALGARRRLPPAVRPACSARKTSFGGICPPANRSSSTAKSTASPGRHFEAHRRRNDRTARRARQAQCHGARTLPGRTHENGAHRLARSTSPRSSSWTSRPSAWTSSPKKSCANSCAHTTPQQKTTILLTSHYMTDIQELCERVIIIDHGSIFFDGRSATSWTALPISKFVTIHWRAATNSPPMRSPTSYGEVVQQEPPAASSSKSSATASSPSAKPLLGRAACQRH